MTLAVLIALQPVPAAPPNVIASDFDLATHKPAVTGAGCGSQAGSDIVVCGRRGGGDYPMEEMERRYRQKPLVAETALGPNATARVYTESVEMQGGHVSKRAMVGAKLKF